MGEQTDAEAISNKVALSIRMAYGLRNIDNLLAMVMLRCSDIKVQLHESIKRHNTRLLRFYGN